MNEYIINIKKNLEDAIDNRDLDLIGNILYDLIQYAVIMKSNNLIFVSSIMRDVIIAYSIIVEEYVLPEKRQDVIIKRAMGFIKEGLPYLNKTDFSNDDIISVFNWVRSSKSETEIDMKEIRNKKEFQRKKITNFIE
ncbi:hypothetical protein LCGC14_0757190 [marine sediment metagenome]|uniref:Uncharacterized protein n=1 Tax=marine sediment metagenome TaxID=412755 RepID=A0A0F9Q6D4_9ZZZZ|nr:hypothetical protein [bacterium]